MPPRTASTLEFCLLRRVRSCKATESVISVVLHFAAPIPESDSGAAAHIHPVIHLNIIYAIDVQAERASNGGGFDAIPAVQTRAANRAWVVREVCEIIQRPIPANDVDVL